MAEHLWTVVCSRGIVDSFTDSTTLVDVIEEITAFAMAGTDGTQAYIPARATLVSFWCRSSRSEPELVETKYTLRHPNGRKQELKQVSIDLQKAYRGRWFLRMNGIPYSGEGEYRFLVHQMKKGRWFREASIPFDIHLATEKPSSP